MTSGIRPYSGEAASSSIFSFGSAPSAVSASTKENGNVATTVAARANEAVTLTENAQAGAQLLAHAHEAAGIDTQAVARLNSAIQNDSFTVPPEALAASIISAHDQIRP
jgi:anti-sigma28 factor (negative regulator of flagellin synthesis)